MIEAACFKFAYALNYPKGVSYFSPGQHPGVPMQICSTPSGLPSCFLQNESPPSIPIVFFQSPKNHARRQRDQTNEELFAMRRIVRPDNVEAFADILRGLSLSLARERVRVRL
jgi:hypothetical protein